MTRRGNDFFVGTFGEDGGPAELAKFDKDFTGYTLPFQSLNPIVGLAWHGNRLYGVEIFPYDNPVGDRQRQPGHVRSQDGRAQGGADGVRELCRTDS